MYIVVKVSLQLISSSSIIVSSHIVGYVMGLTVAGTLSGPAGSAADTMCLKLEEVESTPTQAADTGGHFTCLVVR